MTSLLAACQEGGAQDEEAAMVAELAAEVDEATLEEAIVVDAPAPAAPSEDEDVVTLQKVVVTGSRIKRTDVAGALPTIVITKEDIDASGFRSVTEALQSLPQANAYRQDEQKFFH